MKTTVLKIVAGIAIAYSCQAQTIENCSIEQANAVLERCFEEDQETRRELMPLLVQYQKDGSGKMKLIMKVMKQEKVDKKNQKILTDYLASCGWQKDLSEKAHQAIFMILQHANDSLMRQHFPTVKKRVIEGYLMPDDWATMHDRLNMRAGKPQLFGTQTFADKENNNWVWPVADAERLQDRRDSVNLPSMQAYFDLARDSMGVEMKWDKLLTVDKALAIKGSLK